jgi:hypothetical protein
LINTKVKEVLRFFSKGMDSGAEQRSHEKTEVVKW